MTVSKYKKVKQFILNNIQSGEWKEGSKIPSENKLGKMFSLHHSTAQKALRELVAEGVIEGLRGSGHYIKAQKNKHSGNIAVVVNDISGQYFSSLLNSIQSTVSKTTVTYYAMGPVKILMKNAHL